MKTHKESYPKRSKRYRDFLNIIQSTNSSAAVSREETTDEVLVEGDMQLSEAITEFDPITKRLLVNPYKNKRCKHIYEYSSIEESLKLNRKMRCPVSGCPNKNYVVLADLVPDDELRRKLERRRDNM